MDATEPRRMFDDAPCRCCSTLHQYIAEHLDPDGTIGSDEDPANVHAELEACWSDGSGITVEELAAYMALRPPS